MRIATRLVLILSGILVVTMAAYTVASHRQRVSLLRERMTREMEALGQGMRVVADQALLDNRLEKLDEVLRVVALDEDVFAIMVLDARGQVLAGAASDLECLRRALPSPLPTEVPASGWADCDPRVYWMAFTLTSAPAVLVTAQREVLLDRSVSAALRRQLLLTLTLMALLGLAIVIVLERTLSAPLARLERGIRSLGTLVPPRPIELSGSSGELARLAQAFNEMAAKLEEKRGELLRETEEHFETERRMRESEQFALVGRLSGGLAHELGSPLGAIALRAESIASQPGCTAETQRHAESIMREVDRIVQFMRALLHVARRHGIDVAPADLNEVLQAAIAHLTPAAQAASVELNVSVPEGPVVIRGQPALLRHALLNVMRNSIQALAGHPGERSLRVQLIPGPEQVRIVVEDTGPGIPPEHLPHIFEPFFSTKPVSEGTGLGLALSRGIVAEHGGELQVEPRPGGGLRSTFDLPVDGPPPKEETTG